MKISSKSILSPGRPAYSHEPPPPPIALPTSLTRTRSRRLTNSRSVKGAASPAMFPIVTGKKRGSGFDNPEPSSPKVTCIGQVRVKTKKKHVKNIRSLSRRRNRSLRGPQKNSNSNSSNSNNNNNRQWVHIPLTICETLRTFGSEVSCLFPCRSPCLSTENEERKHGWVVALQDEEEEMDVGNVRRHVFDDLEIVNDVIIGSTRDEGRVSVCVPPKNALLLMRCRSDPLKMEALTSRVWEPMLEINEEKDEELVVLNDVNSEQHDDGIEGINLEVEMKHNIQEEDDEDQEQRIETNEEEDDDNFFLVNLFEENVVEDGEIEEEEEEEEYYGMGDGQEEVFEDEDVEESETRESNIEKVKHFEEMMTELREISEIPVETYEEIEAVESNVEKDIHFEDEIERGESKIEKVKLFEEGNEQMLTEFRESSEILEESYEELVEDEYVQETETGESNIEQFEDEDVKETEIGESNIEKFEDEDVKETETGESSVEKAKQSEEEFEEMLTELTEEIEVENGENEEREKIEALPECLLLMTCEPKLSMEVSKETWVNRSDFTRSHSSKKKPPPPPPPIEPINNYVTNMVAVQYEPVAQQQPARSSCSFSATPQSMIAVLEEKLMNTMGFEPLALTRCKSEPMRRALESCSWQNQLEPPRRASFGVGMAGLGFCQFGS